jgi:hypothetical protein
MNDSGSQLTTIQSLPRSWKSSLLETDYYYSYQFYGKVEIRREASTAESVVQSCSVYVVRKTHICTLKSVALTSLFLGGRGIYIPYLPLP